MGLLIVEGKIDLAQFWPLGESDADTTKVLVDGFAYAANEDASAAKPTTIFQGARARGKVSKEVIDKKGRITVRWQGTDAAELHYQPQSELKKDDPKYDAKRAAFLAINGPYYQHLGKTATVRLSEKLQELAGGAGTIPCKVTTYVKHPNQVFDTYGRLIGNVIVGADVDLNLWMVENGWAFPTFYTSMRDSEIEALLRATKQAKGKGIWRHYSRDVKTFEWDLVYQKKGTFDAKADTGPVVMPKVFRRLAAYQTNKKARIVSGTFESYLRGKEPPETYFETKDFLENGITAAAARPFAGLVKNGRFSARPEELVFQESPSTLVDASGKKITSWFPAG
jgi:endonuclease YncB( thermonuclease family)